MRLQSIVAIVFMCASSVLAQDTTVTLKKLVEKRELAVEKTPFAGWDNGIDVTLHADGAGVKGARKIGKLKITKAVDDVGTDLTKKTGDAPMHDADRFEDVREPQQFGFGDDKKKPTGFDVDLKLPTLSARNAKTIKELTGSFQIVIGGEQKFAEVKSIKDSLGKKLDDPALKAAGISFTIVDPAKAKGMMMMGSDDGKTFPVILEGSLDALGEVSVLDAAGEKLNNGAFWSDEGGKRTVGYSLEKALPKDATLKIEVFPGQKIVTVPFEIKDVKLP